ACGRDRRGSRDHRVGHTGIPRTCCRRRDCPRVTSDANPRVTFARLAATIRLEMTRVASVVAEADLALADFAEATPSRRELRGIGDIVHVFYTGAEAMFEKIAQELNGRIPAGPYR